MAYAGADFAIKLMRAMGGEKGIKECTYVDQGGRASATQMRADEKKKNQATIEEAKVAQVAVENAMKVLKEFYDKAASPDLLQGAKGLKKAVVAKKAGIKEPYGGMQAAN